MKSIEKELDWDKSGGLIPAIVTHTVTGKVLMMAWCNAEALRKTLNTGLVTFYSRSREQLWTKGETSGNQLRMTSIRSDCDNDTLLIEALPSGPVCHTGKNGCFDTEVALQGYGFLGELQNIIADRRQLPENSSSYTRTLFKSGVKTMAQKVGEEGVEVAIAAQHDSQEDLIDESADLLFHLMVLLADKDVTLQTVVARLRERHLKESTA